MSNKQDIADLKSGLITVYYTFCQFYPTDSPEREHILADCKGIMKCFSLYIYDRNTLIENHLFSVQQQRAVQHFYGHINRLLAAVHHRNDHRRSLAEIKEDSIRSACSHPTMQTSIQSILTKKISDVLNAFERLCAIKDYRTPLGIRAFTAFIMWFLPIVLAPYFVWHTEIHTNDISGYIWAWFYFLLLGALVDIKATLDDIFDSDCIDDDIILDTKGLFKNIKCGASPLVQDLFHDEHM